MRLSFSCQVVFLCFLAFIPLVFGTNKAVTYDLGGGRFGDKLVGYAHAKWISYKYNIPLLYKPFIYSNQLALHSIERLYIDENAFRKVVLPQYGDNINYEPNDESVLFNIPYFPETLSEHQCPGMHYYFAVDWDDPGFKYELKRLIKPTVHTNPFLELPKHRISVAVHVREGGNSDPEHETWRSFFLG